jgi:hypothetical protein
MKRPLFLHLMSKHFSFLVINHIDMDGVVLNESQFNQVLNIGKLQTLASFGIFSILAGMIIENNVCHPRKPVISIFNLILLVQHSQVQVHSPHQMKRPLFLPLMSKPFIFLVINHIYIFIFLVINHIYRDG